jgi:hypothetical protein
MQTVSSSPQTTSHTVTSRDTLFGMRLPVVLTCVESHMEFTLKSVEPVLYALQISLLYIAYFP